MNPWSVIYPLQESSMDLKDVKKATAPSKFGVIILARPENAQVYDNRNGKSTVLATALVPIRAIGLAIKCSIYARMANGEIKADAALPAKGVVTETEIGAADELKDAVVEALMTWPGYENAYDGAAERLAGVKAKVERKVIPVRLVKDGKLVALPAIQGPA